MRIEYLIPILSYFLGSIPFGYLLVKYKEGQDIRSFGSGNIGATNVFRKSRAAGILTYLLDAGKGYLAVVLAAWMSDGNLEWQAAAAVFAILGHIFTVWLRFKGGKGVATGCGAFLALSLPGAADHTGMFRADSRTYALCLRSIDRGNHFVSAIGLRLRRARAADHWSSVSVLF